MKYDQDKMKVAYLKNHDLGDVVESGGLFQGVRSPPCNARRLLRQTAQKGEGR